MLRKNLAVLLVFLLFVPTVWGQSGKDGIEGQVISRVVKAENKISERPKNLILFISDGAGPAHFTMARAYSKEYLGKWLALDSIQVGSARTYSTSSRVTDSAAGATAYASGIKTYNGAIGVDAERRPAATILEAAKQRGMATGLVSTSSVTHATPAAFSSHVESRSDETEIARQQLEQGIDVILGGGRQFFLPVEGEGRRKDGRDLLAEARNNGVEIALTRSEFDAIDKTPVLGLFNNGHLEYEIDRDPEEEPSIAELTRKAIDLLAEDPDGFFLMVEGSRIDHAAHVNDAASMVHDALAYDEAVAVGLSFAARDGNTLVVSVSDHETGGLTLGRNIDGQGVYEWHPEVLRKVKASHGRIIDALFEEGNDPVEVINEYTGIDDLSETEIARINEVIQNDGNMNAVLAELVGRRAVIGWTSGGHTAVDVNVYAWGPGREEFFGNNENSEVGAKLAELLGFDLKAVQVSVSELQGAAE